MADPTTSTVTGTKKPWASKTLITNTVLTVAALFVPGVKDYLQAHPEVLTLIFGIANFGLRLVTHDAISLTD